MAADEDYVNFVLDCMAGLGPVRPKRFFSGAALLMDGVQFAMITKTSRLFFVVDDATRPRYQAAGMEPFSYTRSTGRREVQRWYELPEDVLLEPDELRHWVGDAIRIAAATKRPKRVAKPKVAKKAPVRKVPAKKAPVKKTAANKPAAKTKAAKRPAAKRKPAARRRA